MEGLERRLCKEHSTDAFGRGDLLKVLGRCLHGWCGAGVSCRRTPKKDTNPKALGSQLQFRRPLGGTSERSKSRKLRLASQARAPRRFAELWCCPSAQSLKKDFGKPRTT